MRAMKYVLCGLVLLLSLSCLPDDSPELPQIVEAEDFSAENEAQIIAYLNANELESQKSESGLHYIIENQGDGNQPTSTSNVTVAYTGYFLDGEIFDENTDEGITANLSNFIEGWSEGITYFKEGGSGKLLIPAHLGYGSFNYNGIPGGSVLIFDINLLAIN